MRQQIHRNNETLNLLVYFESSKSKIVPVLVYAEKKSRNKQEEFYKKALEVSEKLQDEAEQRIDHRNLGELCLGRGYKKRSEDHFRAALEISIKMGYGSYPNFSKRFKNITQISPKRYRDIVRKS